MTWKLKYGIAYALVLARWRQSMVAALGVTFGIGMFVTLLAFMTGLNDLLDGLVLNRVPHVRLFREIRPSAVQPVQTLDKYKSYYHFISSIKFSGSRINIYNAPVILDALKKDRRISGCTPRISAPLFFKNGTVDIQGVANGIDATQEVLLFSFDDYITEGNASALNTVENSIILGKGLADRMMVRVGDIVDVVTIDGNKYPMKVMGIFQSGLSEFDNAQSYTSIRTVQKILSKPQNYITDIAIKLTDVQQAPELAKEMKGIYNIDVEDIQTANAEFDTGTRIRLVISYSVGVALLIVAGFGIYNILNMLIYEKMDAIAILKATGFSGRDVKQIFLTIALGTGIVGAISGSVLGLALSTIISYIPFETTALPTITTYPVNFSIKLYIIAIIFSIVTTAMAGLLPARKASRVDPVIIIRGR
jgi:lipoprotein-releasing system permease protein